MITSAKIRYGDHRKQNVIAAEVNETSIEVSGLLMELIKIPFLFLAMSMNPCNELYLYRRQMK